MVTQKTKFPFSKQKFLIEGTVSMLIQLSNE
jgi:hypothetical protein